MSVINQTDKIYGSGNGITTTFSFPFKIFDPTQILSYLINVSTGVVTGPQTLNTDYTISINSVTEGGMITYTVAPPTGYNWFVKRLVPYQQEAVIPTEGPLPGLQISNQLDLMTMMVIQDQESVSRSFQLGLTSTFTGPVYMADPVDGTVQQYSAALGAYINVIAGGGGLLPSPTAGILTATSGGYAIQNPVISAGFVSGAALTLLGNTPAGAGVLPVANLPTGTTANKIIELNASAQIPSVDGSLLAGVCAKVGGASVVAASSIAITGLLPGIRYKLIFNLVQNTSTAAHILTFNGDTGSNYSYVVMAAAIGGSPASAGSTSGSGIHMNYSTDVNGVGKYAQYELTFQTTPSAPDDVILNGTTTYYANGATAYVTGTIGAFYAGSSQLASVTLTPGSGTVTGSWALYQLT